MRERLKLFVCSLLDIRKHCRYTSAASRLWLLQNAWNMNEWNVQTQWVKISLWFFTSRQICVMKNNAEQQCDEWARTKRKIAESSPIFLSFRNLIKLGNLCWFWFLWPEKRRTKIVRIDFLFRVHAHKLPSINLQFLRFSSCTLCVCVPLRTKSTMGWW